MKVECIAEEGFTFGNIGAIKGLKMKSNFNRSLKGGKIYIVYAIALYKNEMNYLIYDENMMVSMAYSDLFKIVDNRFPINWECNYYGYQPDSLSFIIGYQELIKSIEHYNGVLEQKKKILNCF
jgi:hypothetical protein